MKPIYFLTSVLFSTAIYTLNAQNLRSELVECGSDVFTITYKTNENPAGNNPLLKPGKRLTITVESTNPNVIGYKINGANPLGAIPSGNSFTFFREITSDASKGRFRSDESYVLNVIPQYKASFSESSSRTNCPFLNINIPILKNEKPFVKNAKFRQSIPVQGVPGTFSKDLFGLINTSNSGVILDDDPLGSNWTKTDGSSSFILDQISGSLKHPYSGTLKDENIPFVSECEVQYTDWEGLSATSEIIMELTAKDGVDPILNPIALTTEYYEGLQISSGNIIATNKITLVDIPVKLESSIKNGKPDKTVYKASIVNNQLSWAPPYEIVDDQDVKETIVFVTKPDKAGVSASSRSTLTVIVRNRTSDNGQAIINKARTIYNSIESIYRMKIKYPSCILAHVMTFLEKKEVEVGQFISVVDGLNALSLGTPNPAIAVLKTAGSVASSLDGDKKTKVEAILKEWNDTIQSITNEAKLLDKDITKAMDNNFKDEFLTDDEAEDLRKRAKDLKTRVSGLDDKSFKVNSLVLLVKKNRRGDITTACANNYLGTLK